MKASFKSLSPLAFCGLIFFLMLSYFPFEGTKQQVANSCALKKNTAAPEAIFSNDGFSFYDDVAAVLFPILKNLK